MILTKLLVIVVERIPVRQRQKAINFSVFSFPFFDRMFQLVFTAIFFSFCLFLAEITLPTFGNFTFVSNGTDVTLPWSYNFGSGKVISVEWMFSKTGEPASFKVFAVLIPLNEPIVSNDTLSGISVMRPATLILQNVNLDHNGIYRISIDVFVRGNNYFETSDILVIVLGKKSVTLCGGFSSNRTSFICSNYFLKLTPDQGSANDGLISLG